MSIHHKSTTKFRVFLDRHRSTFLRWYQTTLIFTSSALYNVNLQRSYIIFIAHQRHSMKLTLHSLQWIDMVLIGPCQSTINQRRTHDEIWVFLDCHRRTFLQCPTTLIFTLSALLQCKFTAFYNFNFFGRPVIAFANTIIVTYTVDWRGPVLI